MNPDWKITITAERKLKTPTKNVAEQYSKLLRIMKAAKLEWKDVTMEIITKI